MMTAETEMPAPPDLRRIVRTEYVTIGEDLEVTLHLFQDGTVVMGLGKSGGLTGVPMSVNIHLTTPNMLNFADAIHRVVGDGPCSLCLRHAAEHCDHAAPAVSP